MLRDPKIDKEISMLSNMPEIIRIVHSVFCESDSVISILHSHLVLKIVNSYHCPLSTAQAGTYLDFLIGLDCASKWIQEVNVKKSRYIKIDKQVQLSQLIRAIDFKIIQLKR